MDYEEFTSEVDIKPGMTRKIDIPAYEHDRQYSYYKSEASYTTPHKFKIDFELKDYNIEDEAVLEEHEETTPKYDFWANGGVGMAAGFCIMFYTFNLFVVGHVLVAEMARERDRSMILWLFVSWILNPLIAILILFCIGKSK